VKGDTEDVKGGMGVVILLDFGIIPSGTFFRIITLRDGNPSPFFLVISLLSFTTLLWYRSPFLFVVFVLFLHDSLCVDVLLSFVFYNALFTLETGQVVG
jgi:hypothetical protein